MPFNYAIMSSIFVLSGNFLSCTDLDDMDALLKEYDDNLVHEVSADNLFGLLDASSLLWRLEVCNNNLSLCITYCYTYNHLCVSIINCYFYMPIVIAQSKYLMLGSLYKGRRLLSVCCIVCMYVCQLMPCHMVNGGLYLE